MDEAIKLPSFGKILNESIQLMKSNLAIKKPITSSAFHKHIDSRLSITKEQKSLEFLSTADIELANENEDEDVSLTCCYDEVVSLVILILDAIGLIENSFFNLVSNYDNKTLDFLNINETITPEVFDKIDIDNRCCLWLITSEMNDYTQMEVDKGCLGNTTRIRSSLFKQYERLNKAAYGEDLDPLLTHLINKCKGVLSLMLGSNAKISAEENTSVSRTDILSKINNLTPLEFEKFSLSLLSNVLEKDNVKAIVSSEHTGKTADGGVDGIVTVKTKLKGTQEYCVQCKHYSKSIGVQTLREFLGTLLHFRNYHQGYFITNPSFSPKGIEFASDKANIVLLGGEDLIDLMIEYEIGVEKEESAKIFKLDENYFREILTN